MEAFAKRVTEALAGISAKINDAMGYEVSLDDTEMLDISDSELDLEDLGEIPVSREGLDPSTESKLKSF